MKIYRVTFITNADIDDAMDGEPCSHLKTIVEVEARNKESAANKVRHNHDVGFILKIEELQEFQIFDHAFAGLEVVEAFNKKDALQKSICSDKMYASPLGQLPSEMPSDKLADWNKNQAAACAE